MPPICLLLASYWSFVCKYRAWCLHSLFKGYKMPAIISRCKITKKIAYLCAHIEKKCVKIDFFAEKFARVPILFAYVENFL